jgi:hypothetical protein
MTKNKRSQPILTGGRAEVSVGDVTGETATERGVEILEGGIIAAVDRFSGARLSGLSVGEGMDD